VFIAGVSVHCSLLGSGSVSVSGSGVSVSADVHCSLLGQGQCQGQCSLVGSVLESAIVGLSLYRGGANILRVDNVHRFIVELVSDLSG
jgi:hypothetical protein